MAEEGKTLEGSDVSENPKDKHGDSTLSKALSCVAGAALCSLALFGALYACYLFTVNMPHESLEASRVDKGFEYNVNADGNVNADKEGGSSAGKTDDEPTFFSFLQSVFTGSGSFVSEEIDTYSIKAENFSELEQMMGWYNESLTRSYVLAGVQSGVVLLISIGVLAVGANSLGFAFGGSRKDKEKRRSDGNEKSAEDEAKQAKGGVEGSDHARTEKE